MRRGRSTRGGHRRPPRQVPQPSAAEAGEPRPRGPSAKSTRAERARARASARRSPGTLERLSGGAAEVLRRAAENPALALVPLRLFLGATFLYAGLDKLLSPDFFTTGAPGSIGEQLLIFARHSPLGGLIDLVEPWAVLIGVAIAVVEIGIGLGALSGYGFRVAALGGAGLSLLFWLTASWATRPYYYGPDLPYAAGWITVLLAGHGNVAIPQRFRRPEEPLDTGPPSASRRAFLEAGILGVAAVAVGSLAVPLRMLGFESDGTPEGARGSGGGTADGTGTPATPTPAVPSATLPAGLAVATTADVERTGSVSFTVPFDAPPPLPAGDPGIIVRLASGEYVAFDATCTHAGCPVEWDAPDRLLICPCHEAVFDPAHGGSVLAGPTNIPLAALPIMLDPATGTFLLQTG
jgi:thiosulfate dehydrogenase (quinone) large subunit